MDDYLQLRYNEVSFKASHNSYQRDETLIQQISWHEDDPSNAGCRGLELDISQSGNGREWSVGHEPGYETNYRQLSQFLAELRAWGVNRPTHDVITVYLELKAVNTTLVGLKAEPKDTFPDELDKYIRNFLSDCGETPLYTPGELMRDTSSVPEGARKYGWPTLGELRGKFIFVISGDSDAKTTYANAHRPERLCFVEVAKDPVGAPSSPDRVFFSYKLDLMSYSLWRPVFTNAARRRDAIIRGYVINGEALWNAALGCGCHVLATDKVRGHPWAKVGSDPFVKLKPLS